MATFAPAGQEVLSGTFRSLHAGHKARVFADVGVFLGLDRTDNIKSTRLRRQGDDPPAHASGCSYDHQFGFILQLL